VDGALRAALLAVLARELEAAEALLARAVRIDSSDVDAWLALGRLFRARGEIGRAIRVHQNLLLRNDLSLAQGTLALADLAQDFQQGGFLRRAIAGFEEVLTREPRHPGALRALGELLPEAREFPRALEIARLRAKLEGRPSRPDEARLLCGLARACVEEGRADEARRAWKRALRRDRACVDAWIGLGELASERGRTRAARVAFERALELDPRAGARVFPRLEAVLAREPGARELEDALRRLLERRPQDANARLALARALAARGDLELAVEQLRQLLERDPERLEARAELGRLLLAEHREHEACKEYAELLDVLERGGHLRHREELA
jgi:lipopolysaccharide biosynthesis regulator YciM